MQDYQRYGVKQIKFIFADKEIVKQDFRLLFITSSSTHFFNKINFEQYLLKKFINSTKKKPSF